MLEYSGCTGQGLVCLPLSLGVLRSLSFGLTSQELVLSPRLSVEWVKSLREHGIINLTLHN